MHTLCVALLLLIKECAAVKCAAGTNLTLTKDAQGVALANGYLCIIINTDAVAITALSADFSGSGQYGKNTLAKDGIVLEREDGGGQTFTSSTTGAGAPVHVTTSLDDARARVVISGIVDDTKDPSCTVEWDVSLDANARAASFATQGQVTRNFRAKAIRHAYYFIATSITGLFERGVVQMMKAKTSADFYGSVDTLPRVYALGGAGDDLNSRGDVSVALERSGGLATVLLSSPSGNPYWSGLQEIVAGSFEESRLDKWDIGWAHMPAVEIVRGSWNTTALLSANNHDFPVFPSMLSSAETHLPSADLFAMLTGIYASPVGNLCTHDGEVATGHRVGQIATTIARPDRGYADTYNYFDPDNYISTAALLSSGDPYLIEQVRVVIERSGSFINAQGQLPHHFKGIIPTYLALSGAIQTGPNVFWILSALNYAKNSGDLQWLEGYMPVLRNASAFLFDLYDEKMELVSAPGSLFIDVFIRGNFTSDSNAMLVGFFREFADAEEAVGNATGATSLRNLAAHIEGAINQHLWAGDHYMTQRNPDGTTRDFVDYDSNLIALAQGVAPAARAKQVFSRVDGGRCTHGRATFVSEKYYGPHDCLHGNVGDSWCSMARIGWFDALARKKYNDQKTFDDVILNPLRSDLLKWTWLHERYACDGTPQRNRTWAYFEYPSFVAMSIRTVRYGINLGLLNVTIDPFGPTQFNYHIGNVHVDYSPDGVTLRLPGSGPKWIAVHGMHPSQTYKFDPGCGGTEASVTSSTSGVLLVGTSVGGPTGPCQIRLYSPLNLNGKRKQQ